MPAASFQYLAAASAKPFSGPINPIFAAALDGNFELCKAMLDITDGRKSLMSIQDIIGYTSLRQTVAFGHLELVAHFLEHSVLVQTSTCMTITANPFYTGRSESDRSLRIEVKFVVEHPAECILDDKFKARLPEFSGEHANDIREIISGFNNRF